MENINTSRPVSEMVEDLVKQGESLREEMMELEKQFNIKKESFLKIQGAIEAFEIMNNKAN